MNLKGQKDVGGETGLKSAIEYRIRSGRKKSGIFYRINTQFFGFVNKNWELQYGELLG